MMIKTWRFGESKVALVTSVSNVYQLILFFHFAYIELYNISCSIFVFSICVSSLFVFPTMFVAFPQDAASPSFTHSLTSNKLKVGRVIWDVQGPVVGILIFDPVKNQLLVILFWGYAEKSFGMIWWDMLAWSSMSFQMYYPVFSWVQLRRNSFGGDTKGAFGLGFNFCGYPRFNHLTPETTTCSRSIV